MPSQAGTWEGDEGNQIHISDHGLPIGQTYREGVKRLLNV